MRFGAALFLVLAAGTTAGCARSVHVPSRPIPNNLAADSPFLLPGLSTGDAWLRYHLIHGDPAAALEVFQSPADRPTSDPLLLSLDQAVIQRQAGEFEKSNVLLEWAAQEAERRRVRSVSRTAASFLVSDRALAYTPTATERSMVPYYRMMNYLDLGDVEGAAVEARRMSALLSETRGSDLRRCRGDAMLNQLAGLVFEKAGEWNDAVVSLRRAEDDYAACAAAGLIAPDAGLMTDLIRVASAAGLNTLVDSLRVVHPDAARRLGADSAEVVVVVERGFIAHRSEEALHVPIFDDEIEGLESDDDDRIGEIVSNAIARLAYNAGERGRWGRSWDDDPGVQVGQALEGAHILRLAWPAIHLPDVPFGLPTAHLTVGGSEASAVAIGNLSALVVAELEAERPAMLARLVTRSLTKYLLSREVEKKAEKQGGELLGFIAGRLMNFAANEIERADTRSWTLLPAEIQIVRRRVAAGEVAVGWGDQPTIGFDRSEAKPVDAVFTAGASAGPDVLNSGIVSAMGSLASAEATGQTVLSSGESALVGGSAGVEVEATARGAESTAIDVEGHERTSAINRLLSVGAGERRLVSMSILTSLAPIADELPAAVDAALSEDSAEAPDDQSSGESLEPVVGSNLE